jgi:phosphoglycolate phosphatase
MAEHQPLFDGVEAVLFDLDGTLVETDNHWVESLERRLRPLQKALPRLDPHALARWLVIAIETPSNIAISTLEHVGLDSHFLGLADRVRRSKGLATREGSEAVEGSAELLTALAARYKLAVVTTRARPEAAAFLEQLGLAAFFPVVVTRQDVLRMKPHPEPVRKAARLLGVPPERCIMVGDTVPDVRAARRAGAWAVGVLSGFGERQEMERAGAHLILDRAALLANYVA